MKVLVEFYGIPRLRAGQAALELHWETERQFITLGEVLANVADRLPEFARHCIKDNRLREGYIANLNGQSFLSDPAASIPDGESLLILSADAGG